MMTRCDEDGVTFRYLSASASTSCRPAALTRPQPRSTSRLATRPPIGEGDVCIALRCTAGPGRRAGGLGPVDSFRAGGRRGSSTCSTRAPADGPRPAQGEDSACSASTSCSSTPTPPGVWACHFPVLQLRRIRSAPLFDFWSTRSSGSGAGARPPITHPIRSKAASDDRPAQAAEA